MRGFRLAHPPPPQELSMRSLSPSVRFPLLLATALVLLAAGPGRGRHGAALAATRPAKVRVAAGTLAALFDSDPDQAARVGWPGNRERILRGSSQGIAADFN